MEISKFLYLYTLLIITSFICLISCDKNENFLNSSFLNQRNNFNSSVVPNQYIVIFKNNYNWSTRKKFILKSIRNYVNKSDVFLILERNDYYFKYPSDFDLIQIKSTNSDILLNRLKQHPAIKNINFEKKLNLKLNLNKNDFSRTIYNETLVSSRKLLYKKKLFQNYLFKKRKLFKAIPRQITSILHADYLWNMGITGSGVKVAIFDTGLPKNHPHFKNVKERTNWTNETTLDDKLGHGTFVAGVIASSKECLGFAPDAELHIYRVFTSNQVSYTSWFLDAFNYAIAKKVNILNLSIGGPDFTDEPFVDKVLELTANNIIMISAIGNDGPLYGTLSNPADQMDVIGVGGINFEDQIAKFSSRGMTTWELPYGYGRVKPDIVTYGSEVRGSSIKKGCKKFSGTSVASPVVTGAVALLMSGILHLGSLINPMSMKQSLMISARRLPNIPIFEQGAGKLDLIRAYQVLKHYKPIVTLFPSYVDFTECPYMWPYCSQPIYYSSVPVVVNVTILNGMGVTGYIKEKPKWYSFENHNGHFLKISIKYSKVLWPWAGWMAIYISVSQNAADWNGIVQGYINFTVQSPTINNSKKNFFESSVKFMLKVKIIPTPPTNKRILWDQYHSLRYPPNYYPRDNLQIKKDPLDLNCDHIHTNFKDLYDHLRNSGYYIEVLGFPYTCFDAKNYGTLLVVDSEKKFLSQEIIKLKNDYDIFGLSIIVFGDWFNSTVMEKVQFYNENTRQLWKPETGGANIPSLNKLLKPWNISFSDYVFEGDFELGSHEMYYASGSSISKFPSNGILIKRDLNNQVKQIIENKNLKIKDVPILGLYSSEFTKNKLTDKVSYKIESTKSKGRIAVYGDSSCLDSAHLKKDCFWMIEALLQFTSTGTVPLIFQHSQHSNEINHLSNQMENYQDHDLTDTTDEIKIDYLDQCLNLEWESPIFINDTLPVNLYKAQKSVFFDKLISVYNYDTYLSNSIQSRNEEKFEKINFNMKKIDYNLNVKNNLEDEPNYLNGVYEEICVDLNNGLEECEYRELVSSCYALTELEKFIRLIEDFYLV